MPTLACYVGKQQAGRPRLEIDVNARALQCAPNVNQMMCKDNNFSCTYIYACQKENDVFLASELQ